MKNTYSFLTFWKIYPGESDCEKCLGGGDACAKCLPVYEDLDDSDTDDSDE